MLFLVRSPGRRRFFALALFCGSIGGCTPEGGFRAEETPQRGRSPILDPLAWESGNEESIGSDPSSDPREASRIIDLHRQAVHITVLAHLAVMRILRPGLREGDLKQRIDEVFEANGSSGVCFPSIVGSGPNSVIIHYSGDRRVLRDGDVVVVDIGATYQGWCANLSRTYPVSGRFTDRQRAIYQLVLDAQRAAAASIIPGRTSMQEADAFVRSYLRSSPLRARDRSGDLRTMDDFMPHSLGHYLSREVHPPADYSLPIPIDQVFTLEPGIYIEAESLGVRIEDDFVLSARGPRNLGPSLPSDPEAIEEALRSR